MYKTFLIFNISFLSSFFSSLFFRISLDRYQYSSWEVKIKNIFKNIFFIDFFFFYKEEMEKKKEKMEKISLKDLTKIYNTYNTCDTWWYNIEYNEYYMNINWITSFFWKSIEIQNAELFIGG